MEHDPNGLDPSTPGAKLDAGKLRVWLCVSGFANALEHVADVTTKGATKYSPGGWQHVEDGIERYMEAFGRHMLALAQGERVDQDTGCLHKAQMAWNLLASLELELRADPRRERADSHRSAVYLRQRWEAEEKLRVQLAAAIAERDEARRNLDAWMAGEPVSLNRAPLAAEAALADIGDADREPGDDLAWCEARAAKALPIVRDAIAGGAA